MDSTWPRPEADAMRPPTESGPNRESRTNNPASPQEQLEAEIAALRIRLEESEETLHAIRSGAVDAFVVEGPHGEKVYALESADRPYSTSALAVCKSPGAQGLRAARRSVRATTTPT